MASKEEQVRSYDFLYADIERRRRLTEARLAWERAEQEKQEPEKQGEEDN